MGRDIPSKNVIKLYLHCRKCLEEVPQGMSRSEYQSIEAGWTDLGLQIRCKRHDANIVHIDFEGAKHPANTGA